MPPSHYSLLLPIYVLIGALAHILWFPLSPQVSVWLDLAFLAAQASQELQKSQKKLTNSQTNPT